MAVQFILGRSGTGKTSYCINAIVKNLLSGNDTPLILLVPEQATYQAERAILSAKGIDGYNRLNVLSFDRLEFLLLGKNTARESVSRIGRQMIIHRILRENAEKLQIFGSSAYLTGLSQKMAQTVEEIHRYAGSPDEIDDFLNELRKKNENSSTFLKFSDIRLVLGEYLKFVESDFYDPDVQLKSVCKAAAASNLTSGAKLWVDGFAGFTGTEMMILSELLKTAADSQIALCLDASGIDLANPDKNIPDRANLFSPTEQTFAELMEMIKKTNIPLLKPVILNKPLRFRSPELAHIEKNIFAAENKKMKSAENIHIISASNERVEVQFAARQIVRLVREKGYRYRDIAVIASDIENYHHYIRAYFDDYNIPFFIDKRKPLSRHPLVELICSALKIVTEGFAHHDMFAYLKTDLVPISRYDIDVLENYCIAFGILSSDWLDDKAWHFAGSDSKDFDEEQINSIRNEAVSALLELKKNLGDEKVTVERFIRAAFDFLDRLKVQDTLGSWIEKAKDQADFEQIEEHQQFYNKLVDVFDELASVFSGQAMSAADFYSILNSAFSQLTLAFIPPTLDQVLVGSVERSRHPDLKAVFLMGATQKQFPVPLKPDSILSDDDRKLAESLNFTLAATVDRTLCERQYLAYIAFTRPSELLYVTYPSIDEKGGEVPRSQFIGDLESLFENLFEAPAAAGNIEIENVCSQNELADVLCERLGKDKLSDDTKNDSGIPGLLEEICSDKELAGLGSHVHSAINYDNSAVLENEVVSDMFGKKLNGSVTKLGTFASCPYRYYAKYNLDLKRRKEFSFEPLDLGKFYHGVLDALVKRINREKKDIAAIEKDSLIQLLNEEIEKYIKASSFLSNFINRRLYNDFIVTSACETLRDFVPAIAQMIRAGSFRPYVSETAFGHIKGESASLGDFEIDLPDGRIISLSGKIDRLDIAQTDDEKAAIIFDYKTSVTKFNWSKYYHALDLQLPVYMLAARNIAGTKFGNIIGAFFVPVDVGTPKTTYSEIESKKEKYGNKASGIFDGSNFNKLDNTINSGWSRFYNFAYTSGDGQYGYYSSSGSLKPDDFNKVLDFTGRKIIELAEGIFSGKIEVLPYRLNNLSPCNNCEFLSVCRFDWQINDYHNLESLNKTQVLENIGGGNG